MQGWTALLKVENTEHGFNGTVLVAQNGKIILEKGYGFQNKKEKSFKYGQYDLPDRFDHQAVYFCDILQLVAAKKK